MASGGMQGDSGKVEMAVAMSIFGTVGIAAHFIDLPAAVTVMFRAVIASLFLLLVMLVLGKRLSLDDVKSNAAILLMSGFCLGASWLLLFESYKWTTVSNATLCNYIAPAFVILASPVFLKEKLTAHRLICVVIAIFGLGLVSGVFQNGSFGTSDSTGIVLAVASALFYAAEVILNKKLRGIGAYDRTLMQMAVAAAIITAYSVLTVDMGALTFDLFTIGLLLFMGVVQTAIAFTLYFGSVVKLKAQTVAIFAYIEPLVALLLSVVILGESLGAVGWIGAALVLGSTLVSEMIDMRRMFAKKASEA